MNRFTCLLILGVLQVSTFRTRAENWPSWRGQSQNGVAAAGQYPLEFSSDKGLAWRVALPGKGSSTPAVWGSRLWLTAAVKRQDSLLCYDLDGKALWQAALGKGAPGKHREGMGANASPVTDGKYVVASFKSGNVGCFRVDGTKQWQKNLRKGFPKGKLLWDAGTSPVIHEGRVILAVLHTGDSYIVAIDLKSGAIVWQVDRPFVTATENNDGYATPLIATVGGKDILVVWGADHLTGHDLKSGARLWTCGGFNKGDSPYWRVIASPVIQGNTAIVPYGRGKRLAAIRLDGQGDVSVSHRVWARRGISADVPTPAAGDGWVYVLGDRGSVASVSAEDGRVRYQYKLPQGGGRFYASPLLAGDTLYCVRENGTVYALKVSETEFTLLHSNELAEPMVASPVPIDGKLLLRGLKHLYCVSSIR